jgi:hypothetical protein
LRKKGKASSVGKKALHERHRLVTELRGKWSGRHVEHEAGGFWTWAAGSVTAVEGTAERPLDPDSLRSWWLKYHAQGNCPNRAGACML